jgi:Coenzyme PQQ synthesis protein D (PqqD)
MDHLRPNAEVISRRLDSGAVLVHIPSSRIFELNETGSMIWELLRESLDPAQITQRLIAEFEISESEAGDQVQKLLGQLRAEGLVA